MISTLPHCKVFAPITVQRINTRTEDLLKQA